MRFLPSAISYCEKRPLNRGHCIKQCPFPFIRPPNTRKQRPTPANIPLAVRIPGGSRYHRSRKREREHVWNWKDEQSIARYTGPPFWSININAINVSARRRVGLALGSGTEKNTHLFILWKHATTLLLPPDRHCHFSFLFGWHGALMSLR